MPRHRFTGYREAAYNTFESNWAREAPARAARAADIASFDRAQPRFWRAFNYALPITKKFTKVTAPLAGVALESYPYVRDGLKKGFNQVKWKIQEEYKDWRASKRKAQDQLETGRPTKRANTSSDRATTSSEGVSDHSSSSKMPGRVIPFVGRKRPGNGRARQGPKRTKQMPYGQRRQQYTAGDLSKITRSSGRKSNSTDAMRMIKAGQDILRYTFRGFTDWNSTGYYSMSWNQPGATGVVNLPLYCLDLNGVMQNPTATNMSSPFYRMTRSSEAAGANYAWSAPLNGLTGTGSASPSIQAEHYGISTNPKSVGNASFLDWISLKLMCVGPLAQPSRWALDIIEFTEERFHPYETAGVGAGFSVTDFNAFMSYLTVPYTVGPMAIQDPKHAKNMKVIKSVHFTLQSKDGQNLNTTGETKEIDLFMRQNKVTRYDWRGDQAIRAIGVEHPPEDQNVASAVTVEPKKRQYMILRMLGATYVGAAGALTATNAGSFDLCFRAQYRDFPF